MYEKCVGNRYLIPPCVFFFFPFFLFSDKQFISFLLLACLLLIHYWEYNLFGYLIYIFFLFFSAFLSLECTYRNSRHKCSHAPACHGENSDPSLSWFHFGKRVIKRAFQKYTRDPISASSSSSSTLGRTMLIFLFFLVFGFSSTCFFHKSFVVPAVTPPLFFYSLAGDRGWMNVRLHGILYTTVPV